MRSVPAIDIIARCEDYALSSAVTQTDRKEAFAAAAARLRMQEAEIDRMRAVVEAALWLRDSGFDGPFIGEACRPLFSALAEMERNP